MSSDSVCWVVPCVRCDNPYNLNEEAPNGCCGCGMLEWLCFPTEEEAVDTWKKQNPENIDSEIEF